MPRSASSRQQAVRARPPFQRHDWYTLLRLRQGIEKSIRKHFRKLPDGPLIDMGAGEMPYKMLFAGLGRPYIDCDISETALVPLVNGQPVPLETGSAAAVLSFQVLEHVWDLDWYLGECRRLLKPQGRLLLSTHGVWLYHPHPTDFRRWTRDGLRRELETRGFEIIGVLPLIGPLAWTLQFRALGYHQALNRLPFAGQFLSALACSVFNARMVFEDAITPQNIRSDNAAVYLFIARPRD